MKAKVLISGNDGVAAYAPGDVLERDGDHLRKLLVHGLAVPEDEDAERVAADPRLRRRFFSRPMCEVALETAAQLAGGDDAGAKAVADAIVANIGALAREAEGKPRPEPDPGEPVQISSSDRAAAAAAESGTVS